MKTSLIARGGVLSGLSIVLLYVACMAPPVRWTLCAAAGILVTIPLSTQRVRMGVMVYVTTGVLALLLLPDKRYAIIYLCVTGLYPLIKFFAEGFGLALEILIKFLFITACGAAFVALLLNGFFPALSEQLSEMHYFFLVGPFYIGFIILDIALSRIIALLRILLAKK